MRHIQRLIAEEHDEQVESVGEVGFAKGIGTAGRVEDDGVGCDDIRVWEYRQTGHLKKLSSQEPAGLAESYRLSPHLLRHVQWNV